MSNRGNFEQVGVEAIVKGFDQYVTQMKALVSQTQTAGKQLGTAATGADQFGKSLNVSTGSILKFGAAIAGAQLGVQAIRGAFSNTIGAAIDFESSFAGVKKTVDATDAEFAQLAQGMRDLAKTIPVNVNELNAIGEAAGQLGIRKEDILDFTETVAKLSATTSLTSDQAATDLARLANVVGFTADEFDNVASVIVALGNAGASTEPEILSFAERIAGAGKIAGLSIDQILAIGEAMSSVGIEAEAGGTAVQKVLLNITQEVATGGEKLELFAATAGLSAEQFAAAWKEDAGNAFALFVEGLGKSGTDAFAILDDLDLKDQRLIRSFLSLSGAGDLLRNSLNNASQAMKSTSAIDTEFGKRQETTAAQLQLLENRLIDVGISIGQVLLPAVNDAISAGSDFSGNLEILLPLFRGLVDILPSLTTAIVALGVAIAAVKLAQFAAALPSLVGNLKVGQLAFIGLAAAITGVDIALRETTGAGLTERIFGDVAKIEASAVATKQFSNALFGIQEPAQRVARAIDEINKVSAETAPIQTGFQNAVLGSDNRLYGFNVGLSEGQDRFKEYSAVVAEGAKILLENGASATQLRDVYRSLSPDLRQAYLESLNLTETTLETSAAIESAKSVTDGWMGSLGLLSKEAEETTGQLEDGSTSLEDFVAGLKDGKDKADLFKEALDGLLRPLTSLNPEYIVLNTQIAQLDQKITTLKGASTELTKSQEKEIENLEALRQSYENQRTAIDNAVSVVDEYAAELTQLRGVPQQAVFDLGLELVNTGRNGEFVEGVFARLRTALGTTDASAAIAELQALKAELTPSEWAALAEAVGPQILLAIQNGIAEGPERVALIKEMESLGLNAGQSLAAGMTMSIKDIQFAMAELANAGVQQAQSTLETGSPSRVMMELGQDVGSGLALGIESSTDGVLAAVSGLIGTIRQEFDDALGGFLQSAAGSAASRQFVAQFGDLGGDVADAFTNALATKTASAGKSLNNAIQRMIDDAEKDGVPNAQALGEDLIAAMAAALETGTPELVQSALDALGGFTAAIEAAAPDAGKTLVDGFLDGYNQARADRALEERVGSDGARLVDLINDAIERKTPETAARLGEFTDSFIEKLTDGLRPDRAAGIAGILFDAISQAIESEGGDALAKLIAILDQIKTAGSSVRPKDLTGARPAPPPSGPGWNTIAEPASQIEFSKGTYTTDIGGQQVNTRFTPDGRAYVQLADGTWQSAGNLDLDYGQGNLPTIEDLIARGVIKSAQHGESYVPSDNMLYALHRGEAVIPAAANPYAGFLPAMMQTMGGGTSIVFDFSGATLTGDMQENEAMMRRVVDDVLTDQLRRQAYLHGVGR